MYGLESVRPLSKNPNKGLHYSHLDLYIFLNVPRSHPEENEDPCSDSSYLVGRINRRSGRDLSLSVEYR